MYFVCRAQAQSGASQTLKPQPAFPVLEREQQTLDESVSRSGRGQYARGFTRAPLTGLRAFVVFSGWTSEQRPLRPSSWAPITKHLDWVTKRAETYPSQLWRLQVQDQGAGQFSSQLAIGHPPAQFSHGLSSVFHTGREWYLPSSS